MATIVGLRREKITMMTKQLQYIDVVDGQQRITTLILLLKAIAKALDPSKPGDQKLAQELEGTLVKQDKASLLLLQTNHDTSDYFANYLREGSHPPSKSALTMADRELLSAMQECEVFVGSWKDGGKSLEDLVSLLKNRLKFILYEIGDKSLVYLFSRSSIAVALRFRGLTALRAC